MAAEDQFPFFVNPGTVGKSISAADVASAATNLFPKLIQRVSGVAAISLITLPYAEFEGFVLLIPTAIFTLATGGASAGLNRPVGLASTAVVGKVLMMTYVASQQLWYPSY